MIRRLRVGRAGWTSGLDDFKVAAFQMVVLTSGYVLCVTLVYLIIPGRARMYNRVSLLFALFFPATRTHFGANEIAEATLSLTARNY